LPWRDLPERFGPWKSVYNRFSNWAKKGHWTAVFKALQLEVDETGSIVDGSVVRAHQDASGGKGGSNPMLWAVLEEVFQQSSTPSSIPKAARSTALTPGQRHEMIVADELLAHSQGKALIADTGYDSNRFRQAVRDKGMKPVIGSKPERPRTLPKSRELYGKRYLVECFFHNLKRFRAIATRFEKTARNFLALTQLACAWLWLGENYGPPIGPSRTRRGDRLASIG
jgi:transposase